MRLIRLALLVLMAALASPSVWSAMDPKINVKVTATPASVTLQRTGLLTQAADLVTIQNDTTNYLNGVSITGTVSLIGSTDALTVSYVPVTPQQGGGCTFAATTSTTSSVNCPVGT